MRLGRWHAWVDGEPGEDSLTWLAQHGSPALPPRPSQEARLTILTSGTTGTPKGASRSTPKGLSAVGAILERVPYKTGQTMELCAPVFHSLGFAMMMFAVGMGHTMVLRRRFPAPRTPCAASRSTARTTWSWCR